MKLTPLFVSRHWPRLLTTLLIIPLREYHHALSLTATPSLRITRMRSWISGKVMQVSLPTWQNGFFWKLSQCSLWKNEVNRFHTKMLNMTGPLAEHLFCHSRSSGWASYLSLIRGKNKQLSDNQIWLTLYALSMFLVSTFDSSLAHLLFSHGNPVPRLKCQCAWNFNFPLFCFGFSDQNIHFRIAHESLFKLLS